MTQEEKVRFIAAIKKFGEEELGLNFGSSFQRVERSFATECHWLYISDPYEVKSIFKGGAARFSYSLEELRKIEDRYRGRYDTQIFSAEANGGGDCQILLSLLDAPPARQVDVVLHEGWHSTLGLSDPRIDMPYALEEGSANIVGQYGAMLFAKQYGNDNLVAQLESDREEWIQFREFVNWGHKLLTEAYSPRSWLAKKRNKERCFQEIALRSEKLANLIENGNRNSTLLRADNNAFFQHLIDYTRYGEFLTEWLDGLNSDLPEAMSLLKQMPSDEDEAIQFLGKI